MLPGVFIASKRVAVVYEWCPAVPLAYFRAPRQPAEAKVKISPRRGPHDRKRAGRIALRYGRLVRAEKAGCNLATSRGTRRQPAAT